MDEANIHIVLDKSSLSKFLPTKQQEINSLFEKFDNIFAKYNKDLGLAKGVFHKLNTKGNASFKSRAIRHSMSLEAVAEEEIKKLLYASLLVWSYSL